MLYVHRLADVHLTGFAPALAALIFDSPCRSATVNTPAIGSLNCTLGWAKLTISPTKNRKYFRKILLLFH
jgi:hypothetical protein